MTGVEAIHQGTVAAATRVVVNAYGTNPRHTRNARLGGCDPVCIPCGLMALACAVADELPADDTSIDVRIVRRIAVEGKLR